jgi:MarR-like DNA-binding transcriptional regulator SgrR of sgrS sRNA
MAMILSALPAFTARRPRRGGTLVVEIGATVPSVDEDPAVGPSDETNAKAQIASLIYDHRTSDGTFTDPGPFRVAEWEPGKHAVLAANEDYKNGRPFVDAIEIQMGRGAADRVIDLELGKADLTEIPVDQARRAAASGVRISASNVDELIALEFFGTDPLTGDARVREAIACSVDRQAIVNFILQKEGEPAGGLLPQWSSGTAFLFTTRRDLARAKELRSQINPFPPIVLGYDSDDPLSHAIGERIGVNARDAGISITTQAISKGGALSKTKARLVRLEMPSPEPRAALLRFLRRLGPIAEQIERDDPLADQATPEDIYEREAAVVRGFAVVPIAWIPHIYGLSARVRDWKAPGPGESWPLADVWLDQIDAQPEKGTP